MIQFEFSSGIPIHLLDDLHLIDQLHCNGRKKPVDRWLKTVSRGILKEGFQ